MLILKILVGLVGLYLIYSLVFSLILQDFKEGLLTAVGGMIITIIVLGLFFLFRWYFGLF